MQRAEARTAQVPSWLRTLARHPDAIAAVLFLALVAGWAFFPSAFAPGDPLAAAPADRLLAPSWQHPFGTDELGRDLYTRVVHGSALSLRATLLAVFIGLAAGSLVGAAAGYAGGLVDEGVMRIVDVILAIPGLMLSLAVIAALGPGPLPIAIAVGAGAIPSFARVVRAETLRVRSSDFVEGLHAIGARGTRVLFRHVLPNVAGQAIALATATMGTAILAVSALSFLGFGAAPPAPEWGNLISGGRNYLATAWWLTTLPALIVVLTVLSINRVSHLVDRTRRMR